MLATISLYIINYPQKNIKWKMKRMWINYFWKYEINIIVNRKNSFIHIINKFMWIMWKILITLKNPAKSRLVTIYKKWIHIVYIKLYTKYPQNVDKFFFKIVNTWYCDYHVCNPTECCGLGLISRFFEILWMKICLTYFIFMNIIDMMF